MISSFLIGKLSASYEGCLILYSPNRWMMGILLLIPICMMWNLRNILIRGYKNV
jgi:hypothetical protein